MKTEMIASDAYGTVYSDSVASLELWIKNLAKDSFAAVEKSKRLSKKRQKVRAEFMVKVGNVIGWWIRIAVRDRVGVSPERLRDLECVEVVTQQAIREVVHGLHGGSVFTQDCFADIGHSILESCPPPHPLYDERHYRYIPDILNAVEKKIQLVVEFFESFVRTSDQWQAQVAIFGTRAERQAFLDSLDQQG